MLESIIALLTVTFIGWLFKKFVFPSLEEHLIAYKEKRKNKTGQHHREMLDDKEGEKKKQISKATLIKFSDRRAAGAFRKKK